MIKTRKIKPVGMLKTSSNGAYFLVHDAPIEKVWENNYNTWRFLVVDPNPDDYEVGIFHPEFEISVSGDFVVEYCQYSEIEVEIEEK